MNDTDDNDETLMIEMAASSGTHNDWNTVI
jgi:hypothetical protein